MTRESRGFPPGFRTEKALVTPELAKELLATMHRNRTKSRMEVGLQEENLRNDSWWPEISPVFMDDDPGSPRSYDAQHRLQAVVNTGISAWMLLIYGVRPEAAEYIDTGRKRTYADMLRMNEVPDYKRQSVLAKYLALYEGAPELKIAGYGIEGIRQPGRYPVSQSAKDAHLNTDRTVKSIHVGEALYRAVRANPSWASYAAARTGQLDEHGEWQPSPFWEKVRSGEHLEAGDPALALWKWFANGQKRDRRPADKRLMEIYAYATAWNKYVTGANYQRVNPVFERRRDGSLFFPAANVPDFLPPDAPAMTRSQLRTAYATLNRGKAASSWQTDQERQEDGA